MLSATTRNLLSEPGMSSHCHGYAACHACAFRWLLLDLAQSAAIHVLLLCSNINTSKRQLITHESNSDFMYYRDICRVPKVHGPLGEITGSHRLCIKLYRQLPMKSINHKDKRHQPIDLDLWVLIASTLILLLKVVLKRNKKIGRQISALIVIILKNNYIPAVVMSVFMWSNCQHNHWVITEPMIRQILRNLWLIFSSYAPFTLGKCLIDLYDEE